MESIGNLLGRRMPKEPDEIGLVKQYILDEFDAAARVAIQGEALVITVTSAALANMLRLRLLQLQQASKTEKRIILRIG
jgi:hypothetical protein